MSTTSKTHYQICTGSSNHEPVERGHQATGMKISMGFSAVTIAVYLWNITALIYYYFNKERHTQPKGNRNPRRDLKAERVDLSIGACFAMLAAGVAAVLVFVTWPPPLEAMTLLLAVLGQARLLDWQDIDPLDIDSLRTIRQLTEKLPDVAAVSVAAYAVYSVMAENEEANSSDSWNGNNDPHILVFTTWAVTGVGGLIGIVQQFWLSCVPPSNTKRKQICLIFSSIVFTALQFALLVVAAYFLHYTLPDGCAGFNKAKIVAIVPMGVRFVYACVILATRFFMT